MPPQKDLTSHARSHLVVRSTLLYLIDPVRGEPTVHSLDKHPQDGSWHHEHLQQKFLDSFALICSTSRKGGETASAVCLEHGDRRETILRVCRNLGIPGHVHAHLQDILNDLTVVSNRGFTTIETENEILRKIIHLDKEKIKSLLEKIRQPRMQEAIARAIFLVKSDDFVREQINRGDFRKWAANLPAFGALLADASPSVLIPHIKWASRARWGYSEQIKSLFSTSQEELPQWIITVHKLGRYYAAAMALINFASKQPERFSSITIKTVEAPKQQAFSLRDKTALMTVLKGLDKKNHDHLMSRLSQTWLTKDPEAYFRKACHHTLTVHAEMQLLSFYDHHPERTPRLLFMGTSKKACYLCFRFMSLHSLKMQVSACHQKIYPSWMPATCVTPVVQKKQLDLIWQLRRNLEQTITRDLETRLGLRRPANLDSTAGPSLSLPSDFLSPLGI